MQRLLGPRIKWLCAALRNGSSARPSGGEGTMCYPETKGKGEPKPPYLLPEVYFWRSAVETQAAHMAKRLPKSAFGFYCTAAHELAAAFGLLQIDDPALGLQFPPALCEPPAAGQERKGQSELVFRASTVLTQLLGGCFTRIRLSSPSGLPRPWVWGIANWECLVTCAAQAFGPGTEHPFFHSADTPIESVLVLAGAFDPTKAPNYFLFWLQRELEKKRREKAAYEQDKRGAEKHAAHIKAEAKGAGARRGSRTEQMQAAIMQRRAQQRVENADSAVREVEESLRTLAVDTARLRSMQAPSGKCRAAAPTQQMQSGFDISLCPSRFAHTQAEAPRRRAAVARTQWRSPPRRRLPPPLRPLRRCACRPRRAAAGAPGGAALSVCSMPARLGPWGLTRRSSSARRLAWRRDRCGSQSRRRSTRLWS